jgi:hypothetical protein
MATVAVDVPPSECESGDVPCAHTSSLQGERTGTSSVVMQHGTVKRMGNRWVPPTTLAAVVAELFQVNDLRCKRRLDCMH